MSVKYIAKSKGNKWVIKKKDLAEYQARLKRALEAAGATRASGGGCDGWCDDACEDHDGCDFSFGEAGECGGFCNDGEPVMEV